MKRSTFRSARKLYPVPYKGLSALLSLLLVAGAVRAQAQDGAQQRSSSVVWKIFMPVPGGTITFKTSSPNTSTSFTSSGTLTFDSGSNVEVTLTTNPGFVFVQATQHGAPLAFSPSYYPNVTLNEPIEVDFAEKVPTGKFSLSYPTGPTSLTPVFDVTGNYQGITPSVFRRKYNLDVAMDEFGKCLSMGTIEGYLQLLSLKTGARAGSYTNQLSGNVGAVKTVNNVPTGFFKTTFEGQRDGKDAVFAGTITGPVVPSSLSGGGTGISGTGTFKGKLAGVPYNDKNMPIQVPLGSSASNLKKAWTIALNIQSKVVKGKPAITVSALLTLPNRDIISYPEIATKYSSKKGYSVSLKKGTNTSVTPNVPDKSSVTIKGLTFGTSGSGFFVTGGTVSYSFLGQKGSGNLADFVLK
jgi:hypothetical protein